MRLLGGKQRTMCRVASSHFSKYGHKIPSKTLTCGWVQAEDVVIVFLENIFKSTLERPLTFGRKSPAKH